MSDWQPMETLDHDDTVMLGKWYEDDCGGYYGESRWYWIASGCKSDGGRIWIDFTDDEHDSFSHHMPTHWRPLDDPLSIPKP